MENLNKNTVIHIITSLQDGGAEGVLSRLCLYDKASTHIVISLMDKGKYGPILEAANIEVHTLEIPRGKIRINSLIKLYKIIKSKKPALVQTWMYHSDLLGVLIAKIAGVKKIYWNIRNSDLDPSVSTLSTIWIVKVCALLSHVLPSKVIVCARRAADMHKQLGYAAAKMVTITNGYDLSVFKPDPELGIRTRAELGLTAEQPVIGFVARYDPQKDHAALLAALSQLKSRAITPTCLLIGKGMDQDNVTITTEIRRHNLSDSVRLLGRRTDIPALMNVLDLHVMSSAFGEGFPNVLAEAMACGTPCVSTDVGDAADIIGETGRIAPPRNPDALARAIEEMLAIRGTEQWPVVRHSAVTRIQESFKIESMIRQYHDAWNTA